MRLDHVLLAVSDLDAARRDFRDRLGMNAVVGGVHPGRGTHNALVHFGNAYVELIGVNDRAAPRAQALLRFLEGGDGPYDFALAVDDLAAAAEELRARGATVSEARDGGRQTPAGARLSWRSADTSAGPFMIEWAHDPAGAAWFADRVGLARHDGPWGRVLALLIAAERPREAADRYARDLGWEVDGQAADHMVRLRMPGAVEVNPSLGAPPHAVVIQHATHDTPAGALLNRGLKGRLERAGDGFAGLAMSTPDLAAAVANLRKRGARVEAHGGFAVVDPDDTHGMVLELVG